VAGVDSQTLPMVIYAMARRGASPVINAISALITVFFGILIVLSERVGQVSTPFERVPQADMSIKLH
jgi:ABC-type spermidine/putrescine transport system permease subunit II